MAEYDAGIMAQLCVSLDGLAAQLRTEREERQRAAQAIRQLPLATNQMTLSGGAGTIDDPQQLRANPGYYWSVRRLTLTGFSAPAPRPSTSTAPPGSRSPRSPRRAPPPSAAPSS